MAVAVVVAATMSTALLAGVDGGGCGEVYCCGGCGGVG